ncbi:hypothetical protein [uncultured Parabacteroides sp.]|uniref:hypothetical protein n=1 Tax=uncultured Parabacteroides sp. TaxID=512312 RepID=UPI002596F98C|nr:hypothetical protein [uncultured Parabacteroides sp.]
MAKIERLLLNKTSICFDVVGLSYDLEVREYRLNGESDLPGFRKPTLNGEKRFLRPRKATFTIEKPFPRLREVTFTIEK